MSATPTASTTSASPSAPKARNAASALAHGQELPTEIDGLKVPASFRDSLLEQPDNWTKVQRQPAKTTTTTAAKADEKED
jgi:hypothetical protein